MASSDGNNVHAALFINGTSHSNNVTVMCRDIDNATFGQIKTFFILVLEFVSKFSGLDCIKIIVGQKLQVLYHLHIMYITQAKVQVESYR